MRAADAPQELEAAIRDLERLIARKGRLGRWQARAVLIPLGVWLLGDARPAEAWLERLRGLVTPVREAWREAVLEELSLACSEHIQSADPRFLGLPDYDFDYTVRARERLEARLVAARRLGIEVPAHLLARVEAADCALEPFLRGRGEG